MVKFGGKFYEKKVADFAKFIKFDKASRNHKNIKKLSPNESGQLKERIIYGPTAEPYRPVLGPCGAVNLQI